MRLIHQRLGALQTLLKIPLPATRTAPLVDSFPAALLGELRLGACQNLASQPQETGKIYLHLQKTNNPEVRVGYLAQRRPLPGTQRKRYVSSRNDTALEQQPLHGMARSELGIAPAWQYETEP